MPLGGCRKAALYVGIGCFGIVLILVAGFALLVWWANRHASPAGESVPQPATVSVPLPAPPASPGAPDGSPSAVALPTAPEFSGEPLNVWLMLEEGNFTIEPGPPGSGLVAEGTFDPNLFELTTDESGSPETGRGIIVRFRAKRHWLVRLLSHFGQEQEPSDARLVVRLPEGQPMALHLTIAKGQSQSELGGLTLTDLQGEFAMGEAALSFARPLSAPLPHVALRSAMGELGVEGLGHARPGRIDVDGSMGEVRLDLGGDWRPGTTTRATLRASMGEMTLIVPHAVRLAPTSSTTVILGGSQAPGAREDETLPADAPILELDATVSMGNLTVQRR